MRTRQLVLPLALVLAGCTGRPIRPSNGTRLSRRLGAVLDFSDSQTWNVASGSAGTEDETVASAAAQEELEYTDDTPIEFEARDGAIFGNGERFHFKGINWFGSESRTGPPLGLHVHSIEWYMSFLRENNFNALRVLFNHESMLLKGAEAHIDTIDVKHDTRLYGSGVASRASRPVARCSLTHRASLPVSARCAHSHASQLAGATDYIAMFKEVARQAARKGIVLLVTCHRITPKSWPGDGLWYEPAISEERVQDSWARLAEALCSQWNVVAVDIQNEPHSSSWGKGTALDWNKAAERIGERATLARVTEPC